MFVCCQRCFSSATSASTANRIRSSAPLTHRRIILKGRQVRDLWLTCSALRAADRVRGPKTGKIGQLYTQKRAIFFCPAPVENKKSRHVFTIAIQDTIRITAYDRASFAGASFYWNGLTAASSLAFARPLCSLSSRSRAFLSRLCWTLPKKNTRAFARVSKAQAHLVSSRLATLTLVNISIQLLSYNSRRAVLLSRCLFSVPTQPMCFGLQLEERKKRKNSGPTAAAQGKGRIRSAGPPPQVFFFFFSDKAIICDFLSLLPSLSLSRR